MGIREWEGISREDLLYRLAIVIGVSWKEFQDLPIWEISNRCFLCGENLILESLQRVQEAHHAHVMSRVKKPDEYLENLRSQMLSDVMIEKPLSMEELHNRKIEHNKRIADSWKNGK